MARQVTGEVVECVDKVAIKDGEGLAIEDDDDKDADDKADDTAEGFGIVVVDVDKRAGEAAQADAR